MEAIHDLFDLLIYHVKALYSAEEQVSQAMPSIIEKASHQSLKNALSHHAGLTTAQKQRLAQIPGLINEKRKDMAGSDKRDLGKAVNKGITGLLEEVSQLLGLELSGEVQDAAIIAAVQKIEHYEICSYGTALAFATQLRLHHVMQLLDETLQEEYDVDDLLTALATAAINKDAVPAGTINTEQPAETFTSSPEDGDTGTEHTEAEDSERTINSPGGRAGTSHRRYGTGESRGH
jgi:ferritin-like metal-binding protein YciE